MKTITQANGKPLKLYNYKTGEFIRELTADESERYLKASDNGTCNGGTGVVWGDFLGHEGMTVFAQ